MQMIIQALLVTTLIAGTFCQKIVFDNTTLISPCTTGARSGIDRYIITGTIGENITELVIQKWLPVMFIQVLRTASSQFKTVCQFDIRGTTCVPAPTPRCQCFYSTTTDQVHFTANNTVQADDSNAVIRAQWQHTNTTTSIYSNKNYTLPTIYDVNAAHLTLTVAGETGNLTTPGSCSFSLTLNKSNDLELCCSNTAKPCYPQISFNGTVVVNNTEMCVTYPTSQLASGVVTGNLVLSYSMCTKTGYTQGSSCSVIPKPVSPETPDKCDVTCIVLIVVFGALFIIAVVIAVYCYQTKKCCFKQRKTSQDVPSQGTGEKAENAHTSKHHKKDGKREGGGQGSEREKLNETAGDSERHYSKHTNQAYDARSSPGDVTINGVNTTTNDNFQQHNTDQQKDSNKQIKGRTNDGSASPTVPSQLPPGRETHTYGKPHPDAVKSSPESIKVPSNSVNATKNDNFQQDNTVQEKDSNKGRTNDGSASQTAPRPLPPKKEPHTHGKPHPGAVESRPASIETTSNKA